MIVVAVDIVTVPELHVAPFDPFLGLAELAGIAALYAWFWLGLVGTPHRIATSLAVVGATALLVLLVLPAPRQYESAGVFLYAVFMAAAAYRWRLGASLVVLLAAIEVVVDVARGVTIDRALVQLPTVVLAGLAVVGVRLLFSAYRELEAAREEIARLAVSEERLRFARDLHDLLGQSLTMVVLKSELAARGLPGDTDAVTRQEIKDVVRIARQALDEVRQAVAGYRRPTLAAELGSARAALQDAGFGVAIENSLGRLPAAHDAVLAWVLREGVTNVVRHSGGSHCTIKLEHSGEDAILEITDNGEGAKPSVGPGSGLRGLEERVAVLGGAVHAGSHPDGQFRLRVSLPLARLSSSPAALSP